MSDSYTKHTTHTDALDTLGSIIGPEEKRDAIHLAVFPVEAGELLQPGQHVSVFYEDGEGLAYRALPGKGVGIVDPFLRQPVQADQRFWLVVYPREIASLRHVWEHPNFPPSGEAPELLVDPRNRGTSLLWLEAFSRERDIELGALLTAARERRGINDEYLTIYGDDANGDIPDEFWHHIEILDDVRIPEPERAKYFSCSC